MNKNKITLKSYKFLSPSIITTDRNNRKIDIIRLKLRLFECDLLICPNLLALILLLNNVIHYLLCIRVCDFQNFNARYILFTLLLSKDLFLNFLNRGYFKRCKEVIIAANTRRRGCARGCESICACGRHSYKAGTCINSIICDNCYLIVSMILTDIDATIQKCMGEAATKNAKTFQLGLNTLNPTYHNCELLESAVISEALGIQY